MDCTTTALAAANNTRSNGQADAQKLKTLFADLLPPLATAELEALRRRIKDEGGIHDPVLITEDGEVLDGHNRLVIDPAAKARKRIYDSSMVKH